MNGSITHNKTALSYRVARLPSRHAVERRTSLRFVSPKFGNIPKDCERLRAKFSALGPFSEAGDCPLISKAPQRRGSFRDRTAKTQRPDWLAGVIGFEPSDAQFQHSQLRSSELVSKLTSTDAYKTRPLRGLSKPYLRVKVQSCRESAALENEFGEPTGFQGAKLALRILQIPRLF